MAVSVAVATASPRSGRNVTAEAAHAASHHSAPGAASLTGSGYVAAPLSLPGTSVGVPVQPERQTAPAAGTASPSAASAAGAAVPRLVVPDVIAAVPGGVTAADLARIRKLSQVRAVLPIDGARITVNGKPLTVLGAPAAALRPWTPPATAASQQVWSRFAAGDLITTAQAARSAQLGRLRYPAAATRTTLTFGGQALLGIAGVDGIVNQSRASRLGLVRDVAVLINAPAADMTSLVTQVRAALGGSAQVIRLAPVVAGTSLPVDASPPKGRPASYIALFQASAAPYCPGLSWHVLAGIGQIESGDARTWALHRRSARPDARRPPGGSGAPASVTRGRPTS